MYQLSKNTFLQGGKYKIEKVLGQGGFGITYLASQELLERKVCIKEYFFKDSCSRTSTGEVILGTVGNKDLVERFLNKFIKEARTISKLEHPNIIRILDVFMENGTAYYVMDFIEGESLEEIVKRRGALPEHEAISYIKQVANALDYLHQHSINHLDVKPANIMIRRDDNKAVLIDFGVSKQYDDQGEQTSTTPVGISHGYAPIEQYQPGGVSEFSPLTDVYSLGATLYRLVTGNIPPHASNVLNGEEPSLKDSPLSTGVKGVIILSMQPQKRCRPQSIRNFIAVIEADYDVETKKVDRTKEVPKTLNEKSKVSSNKMFKIFRGILWAIVLCLLLDQAFTFVIEKLNQATIEKALASKEQQYINDSIAIVRGQDAEKRWKDSIDALNEQAHLATIRKLDEQKKLELEVLELKNIVDVFNSYIKSNTRGWDLMSNFKDCNRIAGFEMETKYFPFGAKYEGVLLMNNDIAVKNSFGDAIKWDFILEGARVGADLLMLKSAEPYPHDIHDYLQNTMKSKLISTETLEFAWLYLYSYYNTCILIHLYGGGSAGNEIEIYLGNDREYIENVIAANIRSENASFFN